MEGTAKIGLSNDGPSAYIDFVDSTLFKDMKDPDFAAKNPHNRGCECSDCSPHFKDLIKSTMLQRHQKPPAAAVDASAEEVPVAR